MSGRYALVIASTEYTDPGLARLTAPGRDAKDFAQVLSNPDICAFDKVKTLLDQPSTSIIEAIDEFFDQRKPDDLLVLYFSGHGIRDEFGSLYLAFKNTIRSRLRSTAVKSDYIREAMDQSRSRRQVVLLDCCNSGAFPQGTKAELGGAMGMTTAFQGYGRFVLTASDSTQFAWEGDKVIGETQNSLFTYFLIKGLEGDADADGDGMISVDELYDYAYQQISRVTPKQTPTKSASKQEGEIVLRQISRLEDIKSIPLSPDLIEEIEDTRPYVREAAVQKLEKILKGKSLGMARTAAEALKKIASDENTTRRVAQTATQILESYRQVQLAAKEKQGTKEEVEAERLAVQKAEEERIAREKADAERKAKLEAEQLLAQKAEEERLVREKREAEYKAKIAHELAERQDSKKEAHEKPAQEAAERNIREKARGEITGKAVLPQKGQASRKKIPLPAIIILAIAGVCCLGLGGYTACQLNLIPCKPTYTPPPPVTTEVPTEEPIHGEVTFWHAYGTGSANEIALAKILEQAKTDLPNITINVLQVPFNDIYTKYRTDVAAGGGPDMFIGPNDSLGDDARAGLVADITELAKGKLGDYTLLSVEGMSVEGKLYGIPESLRAVVLWYNKDMLSTPPATTDELKALMEGGTEISISYGCFHHFGFFGAFGGKIFDANWKVIADQGTGVTDAMIYLNNLYQISEINGWPKNDADGLAPFTEGKAAAITNGNWAMGDYKRALGDKLGVAPLPTGPGGPATPFLSVDGFYFNPNSANLEAALEVALYLTGKTAQQIMMDEAGQGGHVPANTKVTVNDPLITGLLAAFKNGYVRPQVPQLGLYWSNFCGTDEVFVKGVSPYEWVITATRNANK